MKNKFMTKALAVVLSASMALSLSSATALTANGAAAPKLAKKAVTVNAGKKAKNKLAKASFKAGWRITKATVKKTKVAKAAVKKNKKVVVVTGVQKGKSKVVVALKNAKTGAAKKVKFTVKVKVDEVKPEPEPVVVAASITKVEQTAYNTAVISFDKAPETDVTIDTLRIYEGDKEYVPLAVTMSADKLSATVTYDFAESTDLVSFTYTFKDANLTGEASFKTASYKVATVTVADQEVQAGSLQSVKYKLVNTAGMDVTNYGTYLKDVTIEFEGDVTDSRIDAADPQVWISEVGKKATITVTYLAGQDGELKASATLTAVNPVKTESEARFVAVRDSARWYLTDKNDTALNYFVGDTGEEYFYAKAADASKALGFYAVAFDEVTVKSSNEDVVEVDPDSVSKKLTKLTLNTKQAGTATVTVTGIEERGGQKLESNFTIPVRVTEFNDNAASLKLSSTSVTLTNADDDDYNSDYIAYGLFNSNDQVIVDNASFDYEIIEPKGCTTPIRVYYCDWSWNKTYDAIGLGRNTWDAISSWDGKTLGFGVSAQGADPGTYQVKIKATGVVGTDTKEFTKNVSVKVNDVNKKIGAGTTTISSLKYDVEVSNAALGIADGDSSDNKSADIRVKATAGGLFVGYVRRQAGGNYTVGNYGTTFDIADGSFGLSVTSGSKYIPVLDNEAYLGVKAEKATDINNQEAFASGNNTNTRNFAKVSLLSAAGSAIYFFGNANNAGIAPEGTYVVSLYDNANVFDPDPAKNHSIAKTVKKLSSRNVTVKYSLTMPKVDYNTKSGETYATPDKDFLEDDVDETAITIIGGAKNDASRTPYAKAKTAGKTVEQWIADCKTPALSEGDKAYAVVIKYTDRGNGATINFVCEGTKPIS